MATYNKNNEIFSDAKEHLENATSTINTCTCTATTSTHNHDDDYELEEEESNACSIISNEKMNAM